MARFLMQNFDLTCVEAASSPFQKYFSRAFARIIVFFGAILLLLCEISYCINALFLSVGYDSTSPLWSCMFMRCSRFNELRTRF